MNFENLTIRLHVLIISSMLPVIRLPRILFMPKMSWFMQLNLMLHASLSLSLSLSLSIYIYIYIYIYFFFSTNHLSKKDTKSFFFNYLAFCEIGGKKLFYIPNLVYVPLVYKRPTKRVLSCMVLEILNNCIVFLK